MRGIDLHSQQAYVLCRNEFGPERVMFAPCSKRIAIMRTSLIACLSAITVAGLSASAMAGAAPEDAIATLQKRGYTAIEIVPDDAPGYQASACKGGSRFSITMDAQTNIIDVDPRGKCGGEERDYAAAPPPPPQEVPPTLQEAPVSPPGYNDRAYKDAYPVEPAPGPDYAHAPLLDLLYRKGYYNIRVIDQDDDELEVLACKNGRLYEIEIKYSGRIDDIDRKGRCGPRWRASSNDTVVDAPFTGVRVGRRGRVDVEAPFTGVHVDRRGVHIRAPFVDFTVPR